MLFGLLSQVLGVQESIFGIKKAKMWAWKKLPKNQGEGKKRRMFLKKTLNNDERQMLNKNDVFRKKIEHFDGAI